MDEARLVSGPLELRMLSYGAITRDLRVAGRSIVLGYDDPSDYETDPYYLGIIAGRVGNRIAGGRFSLDGKTYSLDRNEGANHLHGGSFGFGKRHWTMDEAGPNAVQLTLESEDGDGGYPGRADVEVVVTLEAGRLSYAMRVDVDRPTPINLAQHNYYNLSGGLITDHVLTIAAEDVLGVDAEGIPTGQRGGVAGTRWDFQRPRKVGDLERDHCLVLSGENPAAVLSVADGPELRFITDQPGLQLYTGHHLTTPFAPFQGLCLEPEGFPDAVNHPDFPSVIAQPHIPYHQHLSIEVML